MGVHMSFLKFMTNEDIFYPDLHGLQPGRFHGCGNRHGHLPSFCHRRNSPILGEPWVNRLPHELLGVIFMNCLPNEEFPLPTVGGAPLVLCRVCRLWRRVATTTPSLWTSLQMVLPPRATLEAFSYGVPTWLARSGALPLTVRMDVYPTYSLPPDFFDVFLPFFPRFRNLRMHILSSSLNYLIYYPTAWLQLTTFTLSSEASLENCISILSLCSNLQYCFFQRVFKPSNPRPPAEPIVLSNLHTLKIYGREDLYMILDCIQTPGLNELDVIFYWPQPWQKARLLGVFERSECPLQRLAIEGLDIPQRDLVDVVRRLEGLLFLEASLRAESIVPRIVSDILAQRAERQRK